MARKIDTDAEINNVLLKEQGSKPTGTASGYGRVYIETNGLYLANDSDQRIGSFITGSSANRVFIEEKTPTSTGTIFSNIPQVYTHLSVDFIARCDISATEYSLYTEFNGDNTASNYRRTKHYANGGHSMTEGDQNICAPVAGNTAVANSASYGRIFIFYYNKTTFSKVAQSRSVLRLASDDLGVLSYGMEWESTNAITSIAFNVATENFIAGTTFRLFGEY